MTNNSWIMMALTLIIGTGVGYYVGQSQAPTIVEVDTGSSHMMSDGSIMDGNALSMGEMMEHMSAELAGKSGDAFDEAFLTEMIVHHQGAVEMAELALDNAKHDEIKDLSRAIIEAQNTEIADMESWLAEWYGQTE